MRALQPPREPIRFGVFELDPHSGELRRKGVRIKLQEQPLLVLQVLLEQPQEIVPREALRKRIWATDTFVDFDRGLYNAIKKLREALGDDAGSPRYIETVPKRGYRFIAPVLASAEESAGGDPGPALIMLAIDESKTEVAQQRARVWAIAGSIGLLIAIGGVGAWGWYTRLTNRLSPKDTIVLADFANKTGEPVFDDTLKQGLTAELQQSTFLRVLSDEKIDEGLRYMSRPADTPLTPEIAREICRREGSKASLFGTIANLGSHYVLTLKAVNCENSELLDEEQGESDRRERVLTELHSLVTRLRRKLGESLASIETNGTQLEPATTTSLEALQAYSLAMRTFHLQGDAAALPLLKRTIELDPNFAQAYADLGTMYANMNEYALSREFAAKAYALRSRVSVWEKFSIDSTYFRVTGQLDKLAGVLEAWRQTYPDNLTPYVNLGNVDAYLGRFDKALENDLRGFALDPSSARLNLNLADDYISLDRLSDARRVLDEAARRKIDESMLLELYQLAFLNDDRTAMTSYLDQGAGKSGMEDALLARQSDTEAFHGRILRSREFSRLAIASALHSDAKETAAAWEADAALREAELGNLSEDGM